MQAVFTIHPISRVDEPMLKPIENLGFSDDAEQDDGGREGLEEVYAKFTA